MPTHGEDEYQPSVHAKGPREADESMYILPSADAAA